MTYTGKLSPENLKQALKRMFGIGENEAEKLRIFNIDSKREYHMEQFCVQPS